MKIDNHMQILIGGKVYKTEGITRIEINGTDFEMDYEWGRYTLKCNVKDVGLFTDKPSMCDILLQDETRNMSHEFIYPSQDMRNAIKESIEQIGKEQINNTCNDKAKVSDDAAVKAMKDAADAIGKAAKAICKAIEPIKIDLSIDGEKFSKLIKDYGKPITRSGG